MATSGTTDFSLTAREFAHDALRENGVIPLDDEMESDELNAVLRRLNAMLKSWQMKGVLWKQETITQAIAADTASVALPDYVRGVNGVRYVESATNERQMGRFERDEYYSLPNKAASGVSTIYYVDRSEPLTLYVWPVPSAAATVALDIDRKMDTVTDGAETVDFPEELTETVYANLAVRCAGLFQAPLSPELVNRARELEQEMLNNYRPASYYFEAA